MASQEQPTQIKGQLPIRRKSDVATSPLSPTKSHLRRRKTRHDFQAVIASKHVERLRRAKQEAGDYGINLTPLFLGIAIKIHEGGGVDVGFASHDGTYSIDFAVETLGSRGPREYNSSDTSESEISGAETPATLIPPEELAETLAVYFVEKIREYAREHLYKFCGVGMTRKCVSLSPQLPARLWSELDIVPFVFDQAFDYPTGLLTTRQHHATVDEEADSMARKCLMYFGPTLQPRVMVGYRNTVEVDASGHIQLNWIQEYKDSVDPLTWAATMYYINSLKERKTKIAFFNSTPQGGGVALMRHALIRFFRLCGVDCQWYVPKPKPEVFRVTKTNHNILQGVADPKEHLTERQKHLLQEWCYQNARRFWMSEGGPLRPRKAGGADVVIVDDPQMPELVQLAKELDPTRPVIYRSHIQVRADLADQGNNPTADVWNWLWGKIKSADVFIVHPVREFVPATIPVEEVGYMPATTDWLDGLNKDMQPYDIQFYLHEFNTECFRQRMDRILFPSRDYIVQIARFDPSKGIPHVLESYAVLRKKYLKDADPEHIPQLVIAGHGAVDDPDASLIYDQTMEAIEQKYSDIRSDIVVMRLGPTDQILNALMSNAKIALQLSTREGFEVKVSEALHKGIPVIATRAGGIPLQVQHSKSGYLVEPGDAEAVARYLHYLLTDDEAYQKMSWYAAHHVSDEVSTVGNALCWVYLADELSKGEKILPNSRWINDMAREKAGLPYVEGENRLPRAANLDLTSPVTGRDCED